MLDIAKPPPHQPFLSADFQPKVQSRLVGGSSVCEGIAEVRQRSQWEALCDSSAARGRGRWEELCREQQCGDLISFHTVDADKTSPGFLCAQEKLSQCYHLQKKKHCNKRVFVTCELTTEGSERLFLWNLVSEHSSKEQIWKAEKASGKRRVNGILGAKISNDE